MNLSKFLALHLYFNCSFLPFSLLSHFFLPSQKGGLHDSEFVSSCLVSRLRDDEPGVVAAVLELGGNVSHLLTWQKLYCTPPSLSLSLYLSLYLLHFSLLSDVDSSRSYRAIAPSSLLYPCSSQPPISSISLARCRHLCPLSPHLPSPLQDTPPRPT